MRTLLALALLAVPALAQEAIAPADIPRQAEEASQTIAAWTRLASVSPAAGMDEAAARLLTRARAPFARLGRRRTLDELDQLEKDWKRERDRLDEWDREISGQAAQLEKALADLELVRRRWMASQSAELPENVAERVRTTVRALQELEPPIKAANRDLVARRDLLVQAHVAVQGVLDRIREERAGIRARLFTLDGPPIWRVDLHRTPLTGQFREVSGESARDLSAWARESTGPFVVHGVVALAVLVLVLRLGRRVREWLRDDASLTPTGRVLARPFAAALLVALLVVPWVHADAPGLVTDLTNLALLIPILWLLFGLLEERAVLYLLAALFLADRLRYFSVDGSALHRGSLLLESVLGVVGARALGTLARRAGGRRGKRIAVGTRLGTLLFGAAVVADVVGAVQLSVLLAGATASSIYLAVLFYAGGRVLDGIAVALLRTRGAQALRMVSRHRDVVERRTTSIIRLGLSLLWLWLALSVYEIRDPVVTFATGILGAELSVGTLSVSLGDVLGFFLVIYASVLVSRLLRFVLGEDVLQRLPLPRGVPAAITAVLHYVVLLLGFFFAAAAAGIDLSKLAFLIGAFGIGIGFGLQNIVNNFVSGLILLFERPIKVGDWLEIGGLFGEVTRIGIRSSTLRTREAAEVIIPNGSLLESNVINWTLSDRKRRIAVPVGVAYGSDVERVMSLLLETAKSSPFALDRPEPNVFFVGFGESSLEFQVRIWISTFRDFEDASSAMHVAVSEALAAAGITIPFPQRDLHIKSRPEDARI